MASAPPPPPHTPDPASLFPRATTQELTAIAIYFRSQPWFTDLKRHMCAAGDHSWTSPPDAAAPQANPNLGLTLVKVISRKFWCATCGAEKTENYNQ
jgi:hypothetical protein